MLSKIILIIYFFIFFFLLGASQSSFAVPVISNVSGANYHNGEITITGSSFGTKSPAAPLWWDNMEGASNGSTTFTSDELSWVISGSLSGSNKHYSEVSPSRGSEASALMTYRNTGYRSVVAPHPYSTKYATGAHWQFDNNSPRYSDSTYQIVNLTVDSGSANKNIWYVHFYYRIDPDWTVINNFENHKKSAVNYGTTIYDSPASYMSSGGLADAKVSGDAVEYTIGNIVGFGCSIVEYQTGANAKDSWVAIEQHWDSPIGRHEVWSWDGGEAGSGRKSYSDPNDLDCRNKKPDTRSFSLGGWYCTNTNMDDDLKRGGKDNFRYFDDVYVDNTFSRVVLANAQNYSDATIVEPQIPNEWSQSSIRVTINVGKLPTSQEHYLFVFDSENVSNPNGIPVYISSNEGKAIPAPINLRVLE
jgi:hypothetical protein